MYCYVYIYNNIVITVFNIERLETNSWQNKIYILNFIVFVYFLASSASVSSIASFPEYDLRTNITLDELKNKLTELIKSKGPDLIQVIS